MPSITGCFKDNTAHSIGSDKSPIEAGRISAKLGPMVYIRSFIFNSAFYVGTAILVVVMGPDIVVATFLGALYRPVLGVAGT